LAERRDRRQAPAPPQPRTPSPGWGCVSAGLSG